MKRTQEAALYARFALGLGAFLRRRMTLVEAAEQVARDLRRREENLVATLRGAVFEHRSSPYRRLFEWAGCELGDVEKMLATDGVEATLGALYDAGIHVSFDEMKGRRPIVRGGRELPVRERDFDNPLVERAMASGSSGTTGPASQSYHDLGHIFETVPFRSLAAEAHGVHNAPTAFWFLPPPSIAGVNSSLAAVVMGRAPERWWAPVSGSAGVPLRQRLASRAFFALSSLHGVALPRPDALALDRPEPIVEWAVEALAREGRCEIRAFASTAMRIAEAAHRLDADLTGARFVCGGEAASPGKQRVIETCGGRMVSFYAIAECGPIATTCPLASDARDLHLATDRLAMIQRPVAVPEWGLELEGLFVTALLPRAPKVLLNVETDDCATLDRRSCGCPLAAWGYDVHLHDVRSYRRLTAEGVTLVAEPARRALEELLPGRFGGTPLDYQLCEEEGPDGVTGLVLRVHPRVALADESEVAATLLAALGRGGGADAVATGFWREAASLRVVREAPTVTAAGKQLPIVVGGVRRPQTT